MCFIYDIPSCARAESTFCSFHLVHNLRMISIAVNISLLNKRYDPGPGVIVLGGAHSKIYRVTLLFAGGIMLLYNMLVIPQVNKYLGSLTL